jgi:single-strand DNA-binding protein
MSGGLNKVMIIGRLGADPELRHTQSNQPVTRMRIATSEVYTDRSGQQQQSTEWHSVVAWGKSAEVTSKYLSKGRQVYIEGRLRTRKWQDKEGKDRYTTEVVAQRVLFLGGRSDVGETPREEAPGQTVDGGEGEVLEPFASDFESGEKGGKTTPDDDLPF